MKYRFLLNLLLKPRQVYLKAKRYYQFTNSQKIVIGSSNIPQTGWLLTNEDELDITQRDDFVKYWKPNTRLAFLAEHVWEHLTLEESEKALRNCFEFLGCGGRLRIAVPDGFHPDPEYIEYVRPGGTGLGSDDHKVLYNYHLLSEALKMLGFNFICLNIGMKMVCSIMKIGLPVMVISPDLSATMKGIRMVH